MSKLFRGMPVWVVPRSGSPNRKRGQISMEIFYGRGKQNQEHPQNSRRESKHERTSIGLNKIGLVEILECLPCRPAFFPTEFQLRLGRVLSQFSSINIMIKP